MGNDVKFRITLSVNGKEKIVDASTDVRQFAKEFEDARTASTKLRDDLLKYNQMAQLFQNVSDGIRQLTGAFSEFTQAYAEQESAESRLAVNMRNTMDAREEDIQSIKDLCAAQQQLGVIGDEVQMVGAQELATYLRKKESLEALIPVMNDMLVQQYGLNVTAEQAQNIAMMLGKVIEGQTGALSRNGYYFDEAQKHVLEYGTEQERVAMLAEIVSGTVGGQNETMRATPSGQIQALANCFGDLKEQVGSVTVKMQPYLNTIASAFTSVAALSRILTAASAANQRYGISARWSAMQLKFQRDWAIASATGMRWAAIQTHALTIALKGLQIASGVFIAFVALTSIISLFTSKTNDATDAMDSAEESARRLAEAQREETEAGEQARATILTHTGQLKALIDAKNAGKDVSKEEKKIIGELNNAYGETMGYFSSVELWYKALIANSENYCRQMVLEAKTRRLANQIAEKESEINDIKYDEKGNKKKYSKQRKTQLITTGQIDAGDGKFIPLYDSREIPDSSPWEIATNKVKDIRGVISNLNKEMQDAVKEVASIQFSVKGSATPPKGSGTGSGTGSGNTEKTLIENAKTYKDLTNNVAYYQQELEKCDVTDKKRIDTLAKAKKATEEVIKAFREMADGNGAAAEGSVDWYETRLKELSKEIRSTGNESVVADLQNDYKAIEEEFKNFKIRVGLEVQEPDELAEPEVTVREAKHQDYDRLSQQASLIQQDYEIGIIGKDEALAAIASINAELERLGMEPIEIPVMTEDIDKARKKFDLATDSVASMGQSLSGLGDSLELPELNIAGTIAQAIATMTQGYANATLQAKELGPIGWLAFAATGLAQLVAMISTVKNVTAFAQGGIVSGPTMALVGEYAGASNNPEVIAPLDKLRSMLHPQGGVGGTVRFEIEGRKLVGVIGNEKKLSRTVG